jgi:hypothetical protein
MSARSYPPVPAGTHSPDYFEPNRGTHFRHPKHDRIAIPQTRSELTGPVFPYTSIGEPDADLTRQHAGEPIGERIILHGRVFGEDGRPVPQTLVEIWQANAAGRYAHGVDNHAAPLDPNFSGTGRAITDEEGAYRFLTIMPGRYPFQNHHNAWRPATRCMPSTRSIRECPRTRAIAWSRRSTSRRRSRTGHSPSASISCFGGGTLRPSVFEPRRARSVRHKDYKEPQSFVRDLFLFLGDRSFVHFVV